MASSGGIDARRAHAGASLRWPGVIIDLDGTLVDSVPDLAIAANLTLSDLGYSVKPEEEIRRYVGNGVPRLVHRVLTGQMDGEAEPAEFERAHRIFLDHYGEHLCDRSQCYPGVREGLKRLVDAGAVLACVTNKPEAFTVPLLERLGILESFRIVVGGDTLAEKKPHPAPIRHAAAGLSLPAERCLVIGDSASDIKAAHAAGCVCVCLRSGYNQGLDLAGFNPERLAENFTAAVDYVLEPV